MICWRVIKQDHAELEIIGYDKHRINQDSDFSVLASFTF
jgi:hypothetical protein